MSFDSGRIRFGMAVSMAAVSPIACTDRATAQGCVWGSFDETRVNYASGSLNGDAHLTLQLAITSNGGIIAPGTPEITTDYLREKDVFYTSLVSDLNGALFGNEQTALRQWVADGGTLIVTAEYDFPPHVYGSYTDVYGVGGYTDLIHQGVGSPVASHPITENVTRYRYAAEVTFTYGPDAKLLGDNGFGDDFFVVLEPSTGFDVGGRVLVFGDHNMFTEGSIHEWDNVQLANNIAAWACSGDCLDLTVSNFVAGQVAQWDAIGGTEGEKVAFVYGLQAGSTVVNGFQGYCATFGINGVNQNRLVGIGTTTGGTATMTKRIPSGLQGTRVHMQAAERNTCPGECMSNLLDEVIR